ncbi:hypothetical protein ACO0LM_15020 [Undibacterium sp. Di26W]|uniref:hypothetical protein n=1 Tax=Undibacterium sp. Di26W TaxID=3413035 RepID=UPI003BF2B37C
MINLARFPSLRQPEVKTPYVAPQSGLVADLAVRITAAKGQFNLFIYDGAKFCSRAKDIIDDAGKVNFSFVPRAGHAYVLDAATDV